MWIKGRQGLLVHIQRAVNPEHQHVWFHFASMGEFEQGRPVLEKIRAQYPGKKIVITFFSPSGYEARKNYSQADHVFYLPADTRKNARAFIDLINPEFAVFIKYDYWYHYFNELHKRSISIYVISAIFNPNYSFFRWYGGFNRRILALVTHFFVQDDESKMLLSTIGIHDVTVSGDTRFDRVAENAAHPRNINEVEDFIKGANVFIAGSTWPEDEKLIAGLAETHAGWKFIIAPHETGESRVGSLCKLIPSSIRFSSLKNHTPGGAAANVLIIDNMGMLSSLYRYGNIAYIGGGFGVGIHNTLEAAAFNIPVIFGPNYQRFREARELISIKAAFSISSSDELQTITALLLDDSFRTQAGARAGSYVQNNTGATAIILAHILP